METSSAKNSNLLNERDPPREADRNPVVAVLLRCKRRIRHKNWRRRREVTGGDGAKRSRFPTEDERLNREEGRLKRRQRTVKNGGERSKVLPLWEEKESNNDSIFCSLVSYSFTLRASATWAGPCLCLLWVNSAQFYLNIA